MKIKPKKCKVCKSEFTPFQSTQKVCGINCAISHTQAETARKANKEAKEQRKRTREQKIALKTKSQWLNETQTIFNKFIRLRDRDLPCISCGTTNNVQYCAGHYLTRGGHPELRFHPFNVHKQCNQYCNLQLSGNIRLYRENLIKRIGEDNLIWLEGPHQAQKLTIEDIKEIKTYYKEQIKRLENE